jgi:Carboxypeptidase regulatory-like domain
MGLVLLAAAGAAVFAQSPARGSLSGKLTDLHSKPLDGATLVLRNAATGTEARTTSAKNGSYRFMGLEPGEYSLEAANPELGRGQLRGIFISAGHEARIQAAVELEHVPLESLARGAPVPVVAAPPHTTQSAPVAAQASVASAPAPSLLHPTADKPSTVSPTSEERLDLEPAGTLTLAVTNPAEPTLKVRPTKAAPGFTAGAGPEKLPVPQRLPESAPHGETEVSRLAPAVPVASPTAIPAAAVPDLSSGLPSSLAAVIVKPPVLRGAGMGFAVAAVCGAQGTAQLQQAFPLLGLRASQTIEPETIAPPDRLASEQLQSLPLQGRHWEDFVMDTPARRGGQGDDPPEAPQKSERTPASVTVDGASTRLAFGGRGGGAMRSSSVMGPGRNESAIGEVRTIETGGESADHHSAGLETRGGSNGLHGQGFLFDRQNFLGAQNPFTQWVKETAPATAFSVPVFTPLTYTAPDREYMWGVGIGSRIPHSRLFWFAAFDGTHRDYPGVAMVKHPESFFAQPSNDEMQVLSARLGLPAADPVGEGLGAYSGMLETLSGLLGPSPRTAQQWVGFSRLDWQAAERHSFTLEGTGTLWNSPGGGLTRTAEPYGSHSFGTSQASEFWLLGRWEAFLTPNLMAVTQGSAGRHILSEAPDTPSPFEQTLNVNAWGQLPQMVVDSRYGFIIGNPSRFGTGSFPDEHLYQLQESVSWVRGGLMFKAGLDWRHNADATGMVRNHTGTYHYSTVENFASDALVFAKYGLTDALDPFDQHNCDQRGRAWRDTTGQLHGLGYLPCYSYYSQTMGPTNWHLSTNDAAGFATGQWQPAKRLVVSAALRWQRQFLPPPIALVNNPDLPLTQKLPDTGNTWAPRVSLAWGTGESRWPTIRAGYGMYFGRTQNSVLETALTQTGSLKGDLNFFMRPTDNLQGGGAPPFPYVLAGEPATVVKPGAVEFAPNFRNAEIHQSEATVEENLPGRVQVAAGAIVSLGRRLPVTIDTNFDPATNPGTITYGVVDATGEGPIKTKQITVPFFASWPDIGASSGAAGRLNTNYQQITELMSRANSTYEAATVRVSRYGRRGLTFHARYTYGHAMDWNPNESTQVSGSSVLDPTDFRNEYGTSDLDIRNSVSGMVILEPHWKLSRFEGRLANDWMLSAIGQFRSGLPFTMRTAGSIPEEFETSGAVIVGLGPGMNGSGGDNRVYGIGRNTYRYPSTWKADVRLGKKFHLGHMRELDLMAESFNLFNHQNVAQIETIGYYILPGTAPGSLPTLNFMSGLKKGQTEFGMPLNINATDVFRPRQFDFGLRLRF